MTYPILKGQYRILFCESKVNDVHFKKGSNLIDLPYITFVREVDIHCKSPEDSSKRRNQLGISDFSDHLNITIPSYQVVKI